jgi:hypothetical protein
VQLATEYLLPTGSTGAHGIGTHDRAPSGDLFGDQSIECRSEAGQHRRGIEGRGLADGEGRPCRTDG